MDCIRVLQRFSNTLGNSPWGKLGIMQQTSVLFLETDCARIL